MSRPRARALAALAAAGVGLVAAPRAASAGGEALALERLDGSAERLALAPGERALLVHFWASWCPDCERELPRLARAARRCDGAGVRVVAVNAGESADEVARFLDEHGLRGADLPHLRDPRGRAWRTTGARGLPANVVWTGAGRRVEVGPRDAAAWERALAELGCADGAPR